MQGIAQDRHRIGENAPEDLQQCKSQVQEECNLDVADRAVVTVVMVPEMGMPMVVHVVVIMFVIMALVVRVIMCVVMPVSMVMRMRGVSFFPGHAPIYKDSLGSDEEIAG